jgi:hypothetical protein
VGSYDPEILGFSSQIDAHCLHIKQDAHRLLYPTEGCISIQQFVCWGGLDKLIKYVVAYKRDKNVCFLFKSLLEISWVFILILPTEEEAEGNVCQLEEWIASPSWIVHEGLVHFEKLKGIVFNFGFKIMVS